MFNKNAKRGTVVASVVSLVLCFAMLLGTTFAWFSTTVSSTVSTVKSGSLKVDLIDAVSGKSLVGKSIEFDSEEEIAWEPGLKCKLKAIAVENTGNIDVKYEIKVVDISGDAALMDVLEFTNDAETLTGTLEAGDTTDAITITCKMDEDAGNQYQNLTCDGIAVVVYATQNTTAADSAKFEEVAVAAKELDVESIENCSVELDTAYTFVPALGDEEATEAALEKYGTWHADYVVWVDQDIAANAITLAGQYDDWGEDWVCYQNNAAVEAGQTIRLIEDYVPGTAPWTFADALKYVKVFNCGAASDVAGLTLNVELRLFEVNAAGEETGAYVTAGTYSYTF